MALAHPSTMPYAGRGGAGNIQTVQRESERAAVDLEASQQAPESSTEDTSLRTEQQYAHTGRGGAGNYYSPKELNEQGTYRDTKMNQSGEDAPGSDSTPSSGTTQSNKTLGSETLRTYGRGGAGNYIFDASENQEKALQKRMEDEEAKRAKLKDDIERGVQDTLAMPPKAKLPGDRFV